MEREVARPDAKLLGGNPTTNVCRVDGWVDDSVICAGRHGRLQEAEDASGEELCHGRSQAWESIHTAGNWFAQKIVKVAALSDSRRLPRVGVVEHVDENDAQRPYVGRTSRISGHHVVMAFYTGISVRRQSFGRYRDEGGEHAVLTEAHIRRATAVHITRIDVTCCETKIGELDRDLAFARATGGVVDDLVGDHKVFGLDVTVKDAVPVTMSHGVTHLREHGPDEAQPLIREQHPIGSGRCLLIAPLVLEEVEQVFAGYIVEHEQEIRRRLERRPQGDYVFMDRQRMMDRGFLQLGFLILSMLDETFERKKAADRRRRGRRGVVNVEKVGRVPEDLLNEVDDGVGTRTELSNDTKGVNMSRAGVNDGNMLAEDAEARTNLVAVVEYLFEQSRVCRVTSLKRRSSSR